MAIGLVVGLCALCARAADFERDIAPLFARHCLDCHNPSDKKGGLDLTTQAGLQAGGDSGSVVDADAPIESEIWRRVSSGEMPPKKPLANDQRQLLKQWVEAGGKWTGGAIDRFRYTTETRAGYDWWSLQPVARPAAPDVADKSWIRQPLDAFVLAHLEAQKLTPSPEADRRTLIRRLSFDVCGLPPTPAEVEAFLNDSSPDAYEKLVDRLLTSSAYGERWGRHWLDIVRFGESQGFERDKLRTNAWPYRDWVISALNSDMPYNEFIRLQIAGDVLDPHDPRAVIATGFFVAGPYDEVGQSQQSEAMKAVVRQDEIEDLIAVTAQTFLGLTVNCARCHDHKFDPVTQKEYYRMAAAIGGVRHGEREVLSELGRTRWSRRVAELRQQMQGFETQIEAIDAPVRQRLEAQKNSSPSTEAPPVPVALWEFEGNLKDSIGNLHGQAFGSARVEGGRLVTGDSGYVATEPLSVAVGAKTLAVWVQLADVEQRGGAAISLQRPDGSVFDAIVFGEREAGRWMAGSDGFVRTKSFLATQSEVEAATRPVLMTLVYGADRSVTAYRDGRLYGASYVADKLAMFTPGESQLLFGLRHSPAGGNRHLNASIERAALFDRALSPTEAAQLAGLPTPVTAEEVFSALSREDVAQRDRLSRRASAIRLELQLLEGGTVYSMLPKPPAPTHVLARGEPRAKGELVAPGGIGSLVGIENFDLPADAEDGPRRVRLARWLTDEKNPLTPRVMANRLWQYHFGVGLVETPNDLGFNGARPSHPELLDWLAAELVAPQALPGATPWSLKHLHRVILLSATYRQQSLPRAAAERVDSGNLLLWRFTPQRHDAETLRDTLLAISGELNSEMGGPGYRDFKTFTFNSQFYEMIDPTGHDSQRRSIYRTWVRSGRSDFLDVFDCPDPSVTSPRRAVTTTPLQALSLLNNSFVLRMADRLAERVVYEAGPNPESQMRRLWSLAYNRSPEAGEVETVQPFLTGQGLPALCRAILNSNEFLYVD